MSKFKNRAAAAMALLYLLPFASGVVHAAEPVKRTVEKMAAPADKPSPPTIDTNKDGKADAWDRDANGLPDAWDVNDDGKPDLFDNNGDGKPDEGKTSPPPSVEMEQPQQR